MGSSSHRSSRTRVAAGSLSPEARGPEPLAVYLLTGGTGRTADEVLRAGLAQFHEPQVRIVRKTRVRTVESAIRVVRTAAADHGVLLHTLVVPKIREAVTKAADRWAVPCVDILGATLTVLADHLRQPARFKAGLSYHVQKERFDRLDAVDFTLAHDDGARLRDLHRADVVLVGPSRVSKSVTCFYLAYRGVRAANVPLIAGHPMPRELARLNRKKVIGVTMNARRLASLRRARMDHLSNRPLDDYSDIPGITAELRQTAELATKYHWRCIDVSYKAVEEVAIEILSLLEL